MAPFSPIATLIPTPRDVKNRDFPLWGVCVHTTGRGVVELAAKHKIDPLEQAIAIYSAGESFPHYVIDGKGDIAQIASENERAPHCGISPKDRQVYLDGSWTKIMSKVGLALWQARWPGVKSPLGLFPGKSTNRVYLGVELIPQKNKLPDGTLFTRIQCVALARLLADIENRNEILLIGKRLVGHEDLEPMARWDSKGGWDPGSLRENPLFPWNYVGRKIGLSTI